MHHCRRINLSLHWRLAPTTLLPDDTSPFKLRRAIHSNRHSAIASGGKLRDDRVPAEATTARGFTVLQWADHLVIFGMSVFKSVMP
jgi:hypothetical protein